MKHKNNALRGLNLMFKLLKYLKDYKLQLIIGPACKLLEAIFELIVPLVMADIIDVGIANGDSGYVLRMGGVMVLLGAVRLLSLIHISEPTRL